MPPGDRSSVQASLGGTNVSAPRRPSGFAQLLRRAIFFALGVFWLSATLHAQDFQYTISDGKVTLTRFKGHGRNITIPESFQGLPVTSIGDEAFFLGTSLTNVTIPNSVTSIGNSSFKGCTGLASLTIPNSVTSIGRGAFEGCRGLAGVTIPNSVTNIQDSVFANCTGLTSVIIPNSVPRIGGTAFANCTGLTNVIISNGVIRIEGNAFEGCTNIASLNIPNSVTSIGLGAFSSCHRLASITVDAENPKYSSLDGVLFNKDRIILIQYPGGKGGEYVVPNSVTTILGSAFMDCADLANVAIGESVNTVGAYAFSGCTGLVSMTIPNSVTGIGNSSFKGCTGLASVAIGESVNTIGGYAFSGCTSLADITLPYGVIWIEGNAFEGCTNIASLNIPNSVISLEELAFSGCTSLTSVTIPNSVTYIGTEPFFGCNRLASITVDAGNPNYSSLDGVLFNKDWTILIQYPGGKSGHYVVPNSVTGIEWGAFALSTNLVGVTIPNSVTNMGGYAFSGCTSLTILNSGAFISFYAFSGCTSLVSVTISNGVTGISSSAFQGCTSLASVTVPDSVTGIWDSAFSDCTQLRSVYFKGNALAYWPWMFEGSDRVTVYYRDGTTGWGQTVGGRPAVLWIPEDDLDHDGMTNQQEFLAGTDPSDAQSLLGFERGARLTELPDEDKTALPPGQFGLYFQTIPGKSYEIQFAEGLGGEWSKAATVAAGGATQRRVVLDRPAAKGFYRLVLAAAE